MRLPRNATEARTNVRYFDELGYRVRGGAGAARGGREHRVDAADVGGLDAALSVAR